MFEDSSRNYEGPVVVANGPTRGQAPRGQAERGYSPAERPAKSWQENALQKIRNFRVEFGPSKKDILHFTNQLAIMVRAGISLQDSLESIAEQAVNEKLRVIVTDLKNQIEAGQSFSQALGGHPEVFRSDYHSGYGGISDYFPAVFCFAEIHGNICGQGASAACADKNSNVEQRLSADLLVSCCAGYWCFDRGILLFY